MPILHLAPTPPSWVPFIGERDYLRWMVIESPYPTWNASHLVLWLLVISRSRNQGPVGNTGRVVQDPGPGTSQGRRENVRTMQVEGRMTRVQSKSQGPGLRASRRKMNLPQQWHLAVWVWLVVPAFSSPRSVWAIGGSLSLVTPVIGAGQQTERNTSSFIIMSSGR